MGDPGLTTPVQRVRRSGGRGPAALGLAAVLAVGLLAWHPWTSGSVRDHGPASPSPIVAVGSDQPALAAPSDSAALADLDPALFGGPIVGPWTGRVTGVWSIVAFLRSDPVSREPVSLRQQKVAVFVGPHDLGNQPNLICDLEATFLRRAAADLPTREVRYLGIAFPADMTVYVDRVSLVGGEIDALPVELGRISGDLPLLAPVVPTPGTVPTPVTVPIPRIIPTSSPRPRAQPHPQVPIDPVRMFALRGGGPWPDGVYRIEAYTRDGLPTQLFACIR